MESMVLPSRDRVQRICGKIDNPCTVRDIGITGKEWNAILEEIAEAADKASTWLWVKRGQQQWSDSIGTQPDQSRGLD